MCVCGGQALLFVASLPGAASLLSELAAIARNLDPPPPPRPPNATAASQADGASTGREGAGEGDSERRERAARRELVRVLCHRGLFQFARCGRAVERLLRRSLSGRHAAPRPFPQQHTPPLSSSPVPACALPLPVTLPGQAAPMAQRHS